MKKMIKSSQETPADLPGARAAGEGKKRKMVAGGIICALLVIAGVVGGMAVGGVFGDGNSSPQKVVKQYYKAVEKLDFDMAAACFIEQDAQQIRASLKEYYNDDKQAFMDDIAVQAVNSLGDGFRVKVKVKDVQKITDSSEMAKQFSKAEEYGVDMVAVVSADITMESFDGEKQEKNSEFQGVCICRHDKWYIAPQ